MATRDAPDDPDDPHGRGWADGPGGGTRQAADPMPPWEGNPQGDSGRSVRERLAGWVRPTPGEVVGLSLLVLGSVVASLLWWGQSVTGPAGLGEVLEAGSLIAADGSSAGPAPGVDTAPPVEQAGGGAPGGEAAANGEVTVHVSGAIARPGLVTLPVGGRVGDAVLAAGGLTREADADRVNLARALVDGEHVHLPRIGEAGVGSVGPGGPATSDGGGAGGAVDADGLIDLNRAGAAELEQLPGIGPARAAAIVEYRERNGSFAEPGDLRGVSGIGEATFQNLAPLVVVR